MWYEVLYDDIEVNSLFVTEDGMFRYENNESPIMYHSTNGYIFILAKSKTYPYCKLYPVDDILATMFISIPQYLYSKKVCVYHINGDLHDNSLDNLGWKEDIEMWYPVDIDGVRKQFYYASSWGRVKSINKNLTVKINNGGYSVLSLACDHSSKSKQVFLHQVIARVYILNGRTIDRKFINHIDGNKHNNNPKNLEWVTTKENQYHAKITHLYLNGECNPLSILTNDEVRSICLLLNKHKGDVSKVYDEIHDTIPKVTHQIISKIKNGRSYSSIGNTELNDIGRTRTNERQSKDTIIEIATCLKAHNGDMNKTLKDMKPKYPWLTDYYLENIKYKHTYADITDEIFKRDYFEKTTISKNDAIKIIECLMKNVGSRTIAIYVFNELHDEIKYITIDKIKMIMYKASFKSLSDQYFPKGYFNIK